MQPMTSTIYVMAHLYRHRVMLIGSYFIDRSWRRPAMWRGSKPTTGGTALLVFSCRCHSSPPPEYQHLPCTYIPVFSVAALVLFHLFGCKNEVMHALILYT